jgi:hypothetical protein
VGPGAGELLVGGVEVVHRSPRSMTREELSRVVASLLGVGSSGFRRRGILRPRPYLPGVGDVSEISRAVSAAAPDGTAEVLTFRQEVREGLGLALAQAWRALVALTGAAASRARECDAGFESRPGPCAPARDRVWAVGGT